MSDDQTTEQELDYLARVQALTDEINGRCQAIELACDIRDGLAEALEGRSWAQVRALHALIVTYAGEELAALQVAMAAMDALERDEAAQETLTAWQAFLARAEAHEVVRAA